jgi:hypothetical protein
MYFQLHTDNHIKNNEELASRVRAEVEGAIAQRFSGRLQRVEVYLRDVNAHKGGVDKRCSIEAHLAGLQPVAVHADAASIEESVSGAAEKLTRALEHTLGRLADRGGRVSMSGEET